MSGGSVFLIHCVVIEVQGTEGWISDANYPIKHVGTQAGPAGLWVWTGDVWHHNMQPTAHKVLYLLLIQVQPHEALFQRKLRYGMALLCKIWNMQGDHSRRVAQASENETVTVTVGVFLPPARQQRIESCRACILTAVTEMTCSPNHATWRQQWRVPCMELAPPFSQPRHPATKRPETDTLLHFFRTTQ